MPNPKIPAVNLSTNIDIFRKRFNAHVDSVGDIGSITTSAGGVAGAINEIDGELGTISAAAMGTTASTVSGAIAELEAEIDVLNDSMGSGGLNTTASTVVAAINEHETDIGNMTLTGLSATNLSAAARELRTELGNHTSLTTTATNNVVAAVNELDGELGTITAAAMGTTASTVSGAIAELEAEIDTLNDSIGTGGLDTTASTVVGAINEIEGNHNNLDSDVGTRTSLTTPAANKASLVDAINHVYSLVDTNSDFRNKVSATDAGGDGSFSYTQSTGVFTYQGPTATDTRAHFNAGEAIIYDSSTGKISVDYSNFNLDSVNADRNIDHTTVNITAGNGLTGGGDISATRTLTVDPGIGIFVDTDGVNVDSDYIHGLFGVTDGGGDGSLSYANGTFVYTGPTADETRKHFNPGQGLTYDSATGKFTGKTATATVPGVAKFNASFFSLDSTDVSIKNAGVTLAKIANIDNNRVIGNVSGSNAAPSELTAAQIRTMINVADGANAYSHPNHTGDVTSTGDGATTISNSAVTNAKVADNTLTSAKFNSKISFKLQNSAGVTLQTFFSPGS